jgi:hypothetical protein
VQSTTAFPLMLAMLTIQQAYAGQPCDDIETAVQTCIAPETRQRQYGALPVHRSATGVIGALDRIAVGRVDCALRTPVSRPTPKALPVWPVTIEQVGR